MPSVWFDTLLNDAVASAAQEVIGMGPPGASVTERRVQRYTLIRSILSFDIMPTVRDSGEGDQLVTLGMGVVSTESAAAGNVPDPETPTDYPIRGWVWRNRYRIYASAVDDQNVDHVRVEVDLRGKRKIENGEMVLITKNSSNQGTATVVTLSGIIRLLYLVG